MLTNEIFLVVLFATCITSDTRITSDIINAGDGCLVPFSSKKNWDVFWPLIFRENGSLYETKTINSDGFSSSVVLISIGDEVIVSCDPNYIKERSPTEYLRAVCQRDGKFLIKGDGADSKAIRDLRCDLRVIEEVLEPIPDCPTPATSVQFGFVNPIDKLAHIIGEACYNTRKGQTRYAHIHLAKDPNLLYLSVQPKVFLKKAHPQTGYKQEFMKAFRLDEFNDRLRNTLDVKNVPWFEMGSYIDENLLGNQQFYATKKLSWNYLVLHENLVNLKLLKKDISALDGVDVYIGSHGVTTLKSASGNSVPVYLNSEKFPVPEIVWIVVRKANEASAFAVFNNPTLSASDITNNSYCQSKCEEITWLKHAGAQNVYLNGINGGIICCDYNEFQKSVEEVPNLKDIKKLFT